MLFAFFLVLLIATVSRGESSNAEYHNQTVSRNSGPYVKRDGPNLLSKIGQLKTIIKRKEICYKYLGCFSLKPPWISLFRPVKPPKPPSQVSTTAILLKRNGFNFTYSIYPKISSEWSSVIDPALRTTVICHGGLENGYMSWMNRMGQALLERANENIILLDWGKGAGKNYLSAFQAIGNMRVAGSVASRFLKYLIAEVGIQPENIHLIGHSLGAHVVGYIGKNLNGSVGWITGLDPGGLFFEGFSSQVRLSRGDALFTDVIHSNMGEMGDVTGKGDCDFYLNIGALKHYCGSVEEVRKSSNCAHEASYLAYTATIQSPYCFMASPTSLAKIVATNVIFKISGRGLEMFNNQTCKGDCVPMGFESIHYKEQCRKDKHGGHYLIYTKSDFPLCTNN